jgi:hypothetical protein
MNAIRTFLIISGLAFLVQVVIFWLSEYTTTEWGLINTIFDWTIAFFYLLPLTLIQSSSCCENGESTVVRVFLVISPLMVIYSFLYGSHE